MRIGREISGLIRSIQYDLHHSQRARLFVIVTGFSMMMAAVPAVGILTLSSADAAVTGEDSASPVDSSSSMTAGVAEQEADELLDNGAGLAPVPDSSPLGISSPESSSAKPDPVSPSPSEVESSHSPSSSPSSPEETPSESPTDPPVEDPSVTPTPTESSPSPTMS